MRSLRPVKTMEVNSFLTQLTKTLALTLLLSLSAIAAQQPAVGRQKSPRLTTDDIRPVEQPLAESKATAPKPEAGKAETVEPKASQPKEGDTKVSAEEGSWRERVNKARDQAKALERAAEEAELRITAIRNELGVSGQSARDRNDSAAELEQAGQRFSELRAQARAAADDLAGLLEYGKQKGFNEAEEPKQTEGGKPNEQYFRAKFAKLNEAVDSAQRRIQLYENRVRDLNQRIMSNSGGRDKSGRPTGGDNFYNLQLQQDLDEAQQKLKEAREALTQAQADLDALMEEARREGVPPGVFR